MNVKLLAHTPNPEKTIAMAAKLCYSELDINELEKDMSERNIDNFLSMIISLGHMSVTEHASFTFGVEGVSRALTHQLVRHRLASYSQKSQRYVGECQFDYVTPPKIANNQQANDLYIKTMQNIQSAYEQIRDLIKEDDIKIANEDARFILPNACETKIIVTMNARELLHFFEHRICTRAQWEIREMADQMLAEVKKVAPILFTKAGPPCVKGHCTEGKMSCNKQKEMKERYS